MRIAVTELFLLLAGSAVLSSVLTVIGLYLLFRWRVQPRLERRLDERLDEAADVVETRIRTRLAELLGGRSRELQQRARDWARTGRDLFTPLRPTEDEDDRES